MIIQHKKTQVQHTITADVWAKLQASGKAESYAIIQAPVKVPREIKLSGKQKPESDNERTITEVPGGDAGENE